MTTWRGPWDGIHDGRWEGEEESGGAFGNVSALLPASGSLAAGIKAFGDMGAVLAGGGALVGSLAVASSPPQWGGGARWTGPFFPEHRPTQYADIAAVMHGGGSLIGKPVAGQAVELAAVLPGGGGMVAGLRGGIDQRRIEDDLLLMWAA